MTISVLIPTYRRPQDLRRCLTALEAQTRPAEEVLVVVRDTDEETQQFLAALQTSLPVRRVCVAEPGVVAAMNCGLRAATGRIVALLDDDAAPWPDWLARIESHFTASPGIGGVGGRDWVYFDGALENGAREIVGKVQWYGRVIGNHHIGVGPAREVDLLKGVNCAYRAELLKQIGFETRLRGQGAQVHWELALGLALKAAGWKLIYDPAVAVNHYPAKRFDTDQRSNMEALVLSNAVHNETVALWQYLPLGSRLSFLVWSILVGSRVTPGLLVAACSLIQGRREVKQRWLETLWGRLQGIKTSAGGSYGP